MLFGLYPPITRLGLLLDELLAVTATTSGAPPPPDPPDVFLLLPFSPLHLPLPPPSPSPPRPSSAVFIRGSPRGEKIPHLSSADNCTFHFANRRYFIISNT